MGAVRVKVGSLHFVCSLAGHSDESEREMKRDSSS